MKQLFFSKNQKVTLPQDSPLYEMIDGNTLLRSPPNQGIFQAKKIQVPSF